MDGIGRVVGCCGPFWFLVLLVDGCPAVCGVVVRGCGTGWGLVVVDCVHAVGFWGFHVFCLVMPVGCGGVGVVVL